MRFVEGTLAWFKLLIKENIYMLLKTGFLFSRHFLSFLFSSAN